jgi:hypothetical protein
MLSPSVLSTDSPPRSCFDSLASKQDRASALGDNGGIDLYANVDLIDDDRKVQEPELHQRRQCLREPGLNSGQPAVDDFGVTTIDIAARQSCDLVYEQLQVQPIERRRLRQHLLGGVEQGGANSPRTVTSLTDHEPGRAMSPAYFTNISASWPVRYDQLPGSIGVLEALDKPMPIGMASTIGWTEGDLAIWSLRVHGADVPGRWVIVDRRFVPVEGAMG